MSVDSQRLGKLKVKLEPEKMECESVTCKCGQILERRLCHYSLCWGMKKDKGAFSELPDCVALLLA